jgi:hypothetical protein
MIYFASGEIGVIRRIVTKKAVKSKADLNNIGMCQLTTSRIQCVDWFLKCAVSQGKTEEMEQKNSGSFLSTKTPLKC